MTQSEVTKVFEQKNIRSLWDDETKEWFFSIVDVVAVLTESPNPRKYWSVLKTRLKKEGSELTTNCSQLKMTAADGKKYKTGKKVVSPLNAKDGMLLDSPDTPQKEGEA